MNQYQINITTYNSPEALERILRIIRHRGFSVSEMKAVMNNDKYQIELTLQSRHELHLLIHQLQKSIDVISAH